MKSLFAISILFITMFTTESYCQEVIKQLTCADKSILNTADSIKKELTARGYIVVKEASMMMESEYEMPVIVPLTEGNNYQFIFIGDITSNSYEVRMFDWNEKEVIYEKCPSSNNESNIISYSYMPQFSEYHMMKPIQINKLKKTELCGYVMLLKKVKS